MSATTLDRLQASLPATYAIERELGAGGMATVFLAEDVKHHRKVAIKVLHPELSSMLGPDRFLKEIALTANLQHPHILPLFDSGTADGLLFYVMPYVEGETLRGRLERERQLSIPDAIRIASEVADALEYAHKRGVIHRDVKPENILLHEGRPLVADFGIALAVQQAGGERLTQTGLSLGTPQYMSPEQAMGERSVDHRADIYALGAVTYEMLAGVPPFVGPTAQSIVARVITERARPLGEVRDTVPEHVELAVATALQKLPADRYAAAAEFAAALSSGDARSAHPSARRTRGSARKRGAVVALALVAAASAGWLMRGMLAPKMPASPVRRAVLPMSALFDVRGAEVTISSDGNVIAANDGMAVVVRRLDQDEPLIIPAAGMASVPFLSADGSLLGMTVGRNLAIRRIGGSEAETIPAPGVVSATFIDDDRIVVSDSAGIGIVRRRGSDRQLILPAARGVGFLQLHVLPGGRRVLFSAVGNNLAEGRILSLDLDTRRVDTLALGSALRPQFSRGWLWFATPTGDLRVVRFDPESMAITGDPISIGETVVLTRVGRVEFAVANGTLVYGERPKNQIVAIVPDGKRTVLTDEPGAYHNPRVSPDGRRIVLDRDLGGPAGRDVWILDVATRALSRATSLGDAHDPAWMLDGRRITYLSFRTPGGPIVSSSADGGTELEKIAAPGAVNPGLWADANTYVAGTVSTVGGDIIAFARDGRANMPLVKSAYDEHSPALSPDGRWLAYTSNETGRPQVYVRPFRGDGERVLVSDVNGEEPVWSRQGRRLHYMEYRADFSRLIRVDFAPGDQPRVAVRTVVLEKVRSEPVGNHANWDLMADGRFLFVEPVAGTQMRVVFDWVPRKEK